MKRRAVILYPMLACAGMALVSATPMLKGGEWSIRAGIESFGWVGALALVLTGLAGGWLRPGHSLAVGYSTMAAYPIWAFIEIAKDPTAHNLWPLELALYGVYGLCGVLGACLGSRFSPDR